MRKAIWIFGMVIMLVFALVWPAAAQTTVIVDGRTLDSDVSPVIENGRTLVPLRTIFEALGAEIDWDESTRTVTATRGDVVVHLTIGDKTAYVGDMAVTLDVPGKILDGRTLVPVRFVSEALGADTVWVPENNRVEITSGSGTSAIPVSDNDWVPLPQLAQNAKLEVTVLVEGDDTIGLRNPDGVTIDFRRTDQDGYEAVHNGTTLRMILHDGYWAVNLRGLLEIGWVDATSPWLQPVSILHVETEPTPVPMPDGNWMLLRELAEELGLEVTGAGDGARLRHPDGTVIDFSRAEYGYQAVHGDAILRMMIYNDRTWINRDDIQAIGWLDGSRPQPQPEPAQPPESTPVPDGDWFSLRVLSENLGLVVGSSPDLDSIQIQHPNGTTIVLSRVGRVYEAVYQGTTLRIIEQDGRAMIDRRGLQAIGWL